MHVRVINVLKEHDGKTPLFDKQLGAGEYVELQLGPGTVVRIQQGRERMTFDVRAAGTEHVEIAPHTSNDITVRLVR